MEGGIELWEWPLEEEYKIYRIHYFTPWKIEKGSENEMGGHENRESQSISETDKIIWTFQCLPGDYTQVLWGGGGYYLPYPSFFTFGKQPGPLILSVLRNSGVVDGTSDVPPCD